METLSSRQNMVITFFYQVLIWQTITMLVSIKLFGIPSFSFSAQIKMEIYLPPWIILLLPSWIICQDCLRNCQKLQTRQKYLLTFVEWTKQRSLHCWDSLHLIVCNTDSSIHIHKFIPQEVWKAFNIGINPWNIIAVLHSSRDTICWISPFCWRSFHIHVMV